MRLARIVLASLALAGFAGAAPAQSPAAAPDDDMMCAVWASVVVASLDEGDEARPLFISAIYHFIGRFEGRTGEEFGVPMRQAAEYIDENPGSLEGLNGRCGSTMDGLVVRLQAWANAPEGAAPAQ